MKLILVLSFLFVLQLFAAQEPEQKPVTKSTVGFQSHIRVAQRPQISVGDVATVQGMSRDLFQMLNSIALIENAKSKIYEFESHSLVQTLKAEVKGVKFNIPSRIKIEVVESAVEKSEVERKILNYLGSICGQCDFGFTSLNIPDVRTSDVEIEYDKLPLKGSFMLPLIEKSSQSSQTKWITGQIKTYKDMPVLAQSLRAGQKIEPHHVKIARVDISHIKDVDLSIENFFGMEATHNLASESVLNWSDFKKELAVKRGQVLKALSGTEDFEVSINVSAEENGFVGDQIKVKNLESNKFVNGIIVDSGMVRIK